MSLAPFELAFGGLTIGGDTGYDVKSEEGITSWAVRPSNDDFPLAWGTIPGVDLVNARAIRLTVEMLDDAATLPAFRTAFLPTTDPDDLAPLTFSYPDFSEEISILARVQDIKRVRDWNDVVGKTQVVVELLAPDPRLYGSDEHSSSVPVYVVGGDGLELTAGSGADLGFDLTASSGVNLGFDFTGITESGLVVVENAGNVDTYPTLLFSPDGSGAMSQFRVTNQTTGESATFAYTLNPGQVLTADMAAVATPKTGAPITVDGSAAYSAWQQTRTPMRLAPGFNTLRFDVLVGTAGNASCLVSWHSANL